jgi:MFS family permease
MVLLCLFYALAYVDRSTISTAAPFIHTDLHLTDAQMGLVFSAFALPYAFLQMPGGWLGDRFGARRTLAWLGGVWAAATVATGASTGLASLVVSRLALGAGESAGFPTATTAMSRWLPAQLRGTGQGVVHAASRIGSAAAPLVVGATIAATSWRVSFVVVGGLSLIWAIVWFASFRDRPRDHHAVTSIELEELERGDAATERRTSTPWRTVVPALLPVAVVDFCYGWLLWVYVTWLPTVFQSSYGLDLGSYALYTSLVLAAGALGDLVGGWLADDLMRRCRSRRTARLLPLVLGLGGSHHAHVPALLGQRLLTVTLSLAVAYFLLELTNSTLWALPMDMVPEHAGAASGFMNTGFGLAGTVSPLAFGLMLGATGGSWRVPLAFSLVLLLVGVAVSILIRPHRRTLAPEPVLAV